MSKCELCNKEHDGLYGSGRFCSKECSRSFSTKNDNTKLTKIATCVSCGKEIEVNKRLDLSRAKCSECKRIKKLGKCKICGNDKKSCKRPDICKKHRIFPTLIKYFGFDSSKIGSIEVYEEFERIKTILLEEYWIERLSLDDINIKYNYYGNLRNLSKILESIDVKRRCLSDANINSYLKNKQNIKTSFIYKQGWHTTWNNKQVYYRSSYELDYCIELDSKQIDYEMEYLRILYWDSQKLTQRVAIPDFYIPSENKIVEIKSNWTYDEQNMKDKIKAYKQHGYIVDVILEHVNIDVGL